MSRREEQGVGGRRRLREKNLLGTIYGKLKRREHC
jgi:hypothetical protein